MPRPRLTASLMAALLPSSRVTFSAASEVPARSRPLSKTQREPDPDSRMISFSPLRALSEMVLRPAAAMPGGDDQHQAIRPDRAKVEARILGFLSHEPDRRPALLDVLQDRAAIAHRRPDMHLGELLLERREQSREEAFTGHRACRERQIPGDGRVETAEGLAGLVMQVEDSPAVFIAAAAPLR